jgi:hypothetical protein
MDSRLSVIKIMNDYITLECPSCGGKTTFLDGPDRFVWNYCGNTHGMRIPTRTNLRADDTKKASRKGYRALSPIPKEITVAKMGNSLPIESHFPFTRKGLPHSFGTAFCARSGRLLNHQALINMLIIYIAN